VTIKTVSQRLVDVVQPSDNLFRVYHTKDLLCRTTSPVLDRTDDLTTPELHITLVGQRVADKIFLLDELDLIALQYHKLVVHRGAMFSWRHGLHRAILESLAVAWEVDKVRVRRSVTIKANRATADAVVDDVLNVTADNSAEEADDDEELDD
jgi:hypothetical protein